MPNVHFYLKKPEHTFGKSLVYLQFKYNGKKLVYSFGQKVGPLDWSKEKKRVKSNRETILNGQYALNELLDKLEKICIKTYNEELVKGIPPESVLKFHLDTFMRQNQGKKEVPRLYQLFDRFIAGEIRIGDKERSRNTLKSYATTRGHLHQFDIATRYHVTLENINLDFLGKYTSFLRDELGLRPNSIVKDIGVLKTVMSEAVDQGYTTNIQWRHKKFNVRGEETGAVYLTEKEIGQLYRFDLSTDRRLEQVRDLFVFGCLTGLRFSRPTIIRPGNIIKIGEEHFLKVVTKEPRDQVTIPCHPLIPEIFAKYQGRPGHLPKIPSNQKFNEYIKEACRTAGLTIKARPGADPTPHTEYKPGTDHKPAADRKPGPEHHPPEPWQHISSLTACRSFATNHYLAGFPVVDLMKITGHKTENAFLKYIRATRLGAVRRLDG